MDDDQFQGGLSGQGGNPVPANNSNTYDFTNGDPMANLDNPSAAPEAPADPADNITVDPLANEPIMDLTDNVNIAAPTAPEEPAAAAPAPEPEGPISEMSRRMDMELGNMSDTMADAPVAEPVTPAAEPAPVESPVPTMEPVAPAMPEAEPMAAEPAVAPAVEPQILSPEPTPEAAPAPSFDQPVDNAGMAFETTAIPGQTPAPAPSDDIPSFTGESRPSVAPMTSEAKKPNKTLVIVLIAAIVLIGGAAAAMMIIPSLTPRKSGGSGSNSGSSSQTTPTTDPDDNNGSNQKKEQDVEKTQVVGRAERGYITIPTTWKQIVDQEDNTIVRYTDAEGDFDVLVNSAPITEVTAESFTQYQLGLSKPEAKEGEELEAEETTLGSFKNVYKIEYYATARSKYVKKYVFESTTTNTTYFIWMECSNQKSSYFTSIPKTFSVVKK